MLSRFNLTNTMKRTIFTFALFCLFHLAVFAQETFPYNGVSEPRDGLYAFTNATIYVSYDQKLEDGTLIIRKGRVLNVGQGIAIPDDAVIIDAKGYVIYPAFIDLYSDYGLPEPPRKTSGSRWPGTPQMESSRKGAFAWNEALKTDYRASEHFASDSKKAPALWKAGFGAALVHRPDGISRGSAAFVLIGKEREHELLLKPEAAHVMSFKKGSSKQNYPSSLMGSIALLRQTYLDGQWYAAGGAGEETNLSLEAWNELQKLPQLFIAGDKYDVLRAGRIAKEFGKSYIIASNGDTYQRLEEIKALGFPLILPLNFPRAYDVENPFDARRVSLAQMKHWELAPYNPARVAEAGISFALTAHGFRQMKDFLPHLRKAVRMGLSANDALKALTYTPANLLGLYDLIGSLERGKTANFFIASGDIFREGTKIRQMWVHGTPVMYSDLQQPDLSGNYELLIGEKSYDLWVEGKPGSHKAFILQADSSKIKVSLKVSQGVVSMNFSEKGKGYWRLSGHLSEEHWAGYAEGPDGVRENWEAIPKRSLRGDAEETSENGPQKADAGKETAPGPVIYPFTAYGWAERPQPGKYLIRNATVWTCEEEGVLEHTDVLIENGKIARIGQGLPEGDAQVIDATGMHLTPGIIDEHSHIAISRGVNESTQASSAEVRIGDVVNPDDINIYRQLAGGVTTSHLLHGSANPIGGQTQLIKMRWGYAPEDMKFEGADGFIKFALGENVKQSNWGDQFRIRYPQTRMGVEQIYEDYFTRAEEYARKKASGKPYRTDLELEALLEILQGKRFITCHSYRQSEIVMLMRVAERHGFHINTFTHILEGYKVAEKMRKHGAGASTFSDWWTYKYEVIDAIPYNGAIMYEHKLVVAYNSDDAEMGRRLNQEAAKAVKYGGVPEEEALKFVTLNPAKLLHIDNRTGSIKPGKDADLVLWNDEPLSVYAVAQKTWVDGILFFDREKDAEMRAWIQKERARLIQKMMEEKKSGAPMQKARGEHHVLYECDTLEEYE